MRKVISIGYTWIYCPVGFPWPFQDVSISERSVYSYSHAQRHHGSRYITMRVLYLEMAGLTEESHCQVRAHFVGQMGSLFQLAKPKQLSLHRAKTTARHMLGFWGAAKDPWRAAEITVERAFCSSPRCYIHGWDQEPASIYWSSIRTEHLTLPEMWEKATSEKRRSLIRGSSSLFWVVIL